MLLLFHLITVKASLHKDVYENPYLHLTNQMIDLVISSKHKKEVNQLLSQIFYKYREELSQIYRSRLLLILFRIHKLPKQMQELNKNERDM